MCRCSAFKALFLGTTSSRRTLTTSNRLLRALGARDTTKGRKDHAAALPKTRPRSFSAGKLSSGRNSAPQIDGIPQHRAGVSWPSSLGRRGHRLLVDHTSQSSVLLSIALAVLIPQAMTPSSGNGWICLAILPIEAVGKSFRRVGISTVFSYLSAYRLNRQPSIQVQP